MNLGVIFGGMACEHEVSVISAVQMMQHVNTDKYHLVPIYISTEGLWYTGDALTRMDTYKSFAEIKSSLTRVTLDIGDRRGCLRACDTEKKKSFLGRRHLFTEVIIDCMFIVMHGLNGEDGTIQGVCEIADIPYTSCSVLGSALGLDKIMMKAVFKSAGIPSLEGVSFTKGDYAHHITKVREDISQLHFPVIVKPANLGSSIGVSRVDSEETLDEAIELAFHFDRRILIERCLDKPIELNCSVLGYDDECEASVLEMPVYEGAILDTDSKYAKNSGMAGAEHKIPAPVSAELTEQLQSLSKRIFRLFDCKGIVRIDYMVDRETQEFYVTEINTIPGSLAFYLWERSGLYYSQLIDKAVAYALAAYSDQKNLMSVMPLNLFNTVSFPDKLGGTKGGIK